MVALINQFLFLLKNKSFHPKKNFLLNFLDNVKKKCCWKGKKNKKKNIKRKKIAINGEIVKKLKENGWNCLQI